MSIQVKTSMRTLNFQNFNFLSETGKMYSSIVISRCLSFQNLSPWTFKKLNKPQPYPQGLY